jgi:hypothetical protein
MLKDISILLDFFLFLLNYKAWFFFGSYLSLQKGLSYYFDWVEEKQKNSNSYHRRHEEESCVKQFVEKRHNHPVFVHVVRLHVELVN